MKDTDQLARDIASLVWAVQRRPGAEALAGLAVIRAELDAATDDLVTRLRSVDGGEHSWAEIAEALGISRQAAQQRFRKAGGTRLPGGQPSRLR